MFSLARHCLSRASRLLGRRVMSRIRIFAVLYVIWVVLELIVWFYGGKVK
jgi:hypothetical protein